MSTFDRVRARLARDPTPYERAWLTSINAVGLLVVLGVLFDSTLVLGRGQTGIFQRALYPLAPPAVTLGVAAREGTRRGVTLSAALLAVYVAGLSFVGTITAMLSTAPWYAAVGVVGAGLLALAGYLFVA